MKDRASGTPVRRRRARPAATAAILVALLLALAGCGAEEEPAVAAAAAAPAPSVMVTPAARENVTRSAGFLGRIEAIDRVDLLARVTGFLEERRFKEGQEVNRGDLLFVIERDPYEAVVAQRQAEVASAEAEVVNTEAQLRRAEQLVKRGNIPEAEVDERRRLSGRPGQCARGPGSLARGRARPRLHRDLRADHRQDRPRGLQRRQPGGAGQRSARDDREPGADVRHLPGERGPDP